MPRSPFFGIGEQLVAAAVSLCVRNGRVDQFLVVRLAVYDLDVLLDGRMIVLKPCECVDHLGPEIGNLFVELAPVYVGLFSRPQPFP